MQTYIEGWKLGLKAVAIYRDGCKRSQPVNTGARSRRQKREGRRARRQRVQGRARCAAACRPRGSRITHKFEIAGHEGYLTVGLYDDGTPGELFITMAKEGSTVGGLMDSFGTAISCACSTACR